MRRQAAQSDKSKFWRETGSKQESKTFERVLKYLDMLRGKGVEIVCAPRLMLALTGTLYALGDSEHRFVEQEESGS